MSGSARSAAEERSRAAAAPFEVWLAVVERETATGTRYVEYSEVVPCRSRSDAEARALEPGALILDCTTGEVFEPLRRAG